MRRTKEVYRARVPFGKALLVCALLLASGWAVSLGRVAFPRQRPDPGKPALDNSLDLPRLFSQGLPAGMVEFDVDNPPGSSYPRSPRLAVLDKHGLRIFRAEGVSLTREFALPDPEGIPWDTLESFPEGVLSGVVIWTSLGASRTGGAVICYVAGHPQVVFEGACFDFVDLVFDGIPEILSSKCDTEMDKPTQYVTVWTWDGQRYVKVKDVAVADLYSKAIVAAVREAKSRPK